ncbi:XdhC family protein [Paraburkholderia sp. C35]|uniref:XdhC family protein n=1 Tax=Paraburkholderia sp. C35 TaxID=2126993 RepID=UPI000D68FFB6|nr:XdhC family protein [Paraburkholderia sp. C35]
MNVEPFETATTTAGLLQLEHRLLADGAPFAVVTGIRAAPPTSPQVGAQALVDGDGTLHGWSGGGCARSIGIEAARQSMRCGQPRRVRISNEPSPPDAEVEAHAMPCASNGALEIFIQPTVPAPLVVVFGATPAAHEACVLARRVGLRASLAADTARPGEARFDAGALKHAGASFALIATQGDGDEDALEAALRSPVEAVLLIASRRKADRLRETMHERGIGAARLAALHAPAGPAIQAHTPQEIALGAVAGLVALRHMREQTDASVQPATQHEGVATEAVPRLTPCEAPDLPAADATRYVNPVCGMSIEIATAKHVVEYGGQKIWFCCDCCKAAFERSPDSYLAAPQGGSEGTSDHQVTLHAEAR